MLFKKRQRSKKDYQLTYDNLAIPEVHTKKESQPPSQETDDKPSISYDGVAIPEIHPQHKN